MLSVQFLNLSFILRHLIFLKANRLCSWIYQTWKWSGWPYLFNNSLRQVLSSEKKWDLVLGFQIFHICKSYMYMVLFNNVYVSFSLESQLSQSFCLLSPIGRHLIERFFFNVGFLVWRISVLSCSVLPKWSRHLLSIYHYNVTISYSCVGKKILKST